MSSGKDKKSYKLGLALSGGGARGFAHLGAIKALNEAGIYPDIIAGVSAGSIVGALYADGYTPDDIIKILSERTFLNYVKFNLLKDGLMKLTGLQATLELKLSAKTFDELKIPLIIVASDLNEGKPVYFKSGSLIDKVLASSSIPILFPPVLIENHSFVDGGLFENLPVSPLRNICDFVIGININPPIKQENFKSFIQIAERVFHLSVLTNMLNSFELCDMLVAPTKLNGYGLLDISKGKEIFKIGYNETKSMLKKSNLLQQYSLLR
jgi:NTE family protein